MKHIVCSTCLLFLVSCHGGTHLQIPFFSWGDQEPGISQSGATDSSELGVSETEHNTTQILEQGMQQKVSITQGSSPQIQTGTISTNSEALSGFLEKNDIQKPTDPDTIASENTVKQQILEANKVSRSLPSEDGIVRRVPTIPEPTSLKLVDFPEAETTWGTVLNSGGTIPTTGYTTVYFNTETQQVSKIFTQDSISVAGAWDLEEIPSEDFGAYFVGNITIGQPATYQFYSTTGWSKTRMILDGKVLGEGVIDVELEPGVYTLEVEHINNWHTIDFTAGYSIPLPEFTLEAAITELDTVRATPDLKIWYAGIHESNGEGHSITLNLAAEKDPIALILSSYGTAHWNIQNPSNTPIAAVVFATYEKGSSVSGISDTTKLIKMAGYGEIPTLYNPLPSCSSHGGIFHCEGGLNEFNDLKSSSTRLLGDVPAGFAGKYSASQLQLPGRVLDAQEYKKIQQEKNKILEEKNEVENPKGFDNMFQ